MKDTFISTGCAARVISPEPGAQMAGYFNARTMKTVRDDLFARAIVIGEGADSIILVSCDLIAIPEEISDPAKKQAADRHGIPAHRICISATHTHTGPEIRRSNVVKHDPEYNKRLISTLADVISEACADRFEARMHYGRTKVEGLSFNRLYRLKNGTEIFGRNESLKHEIIGSAGPLDTALQTLSFKDADGRLRALAVNFACHPDTYGMANGDFISADWPGEMTRALQAVYGSDLHVLFLQGCCGDINHVNYDCSWQKLSGEHKTVQIGKGIAGAAMLAAERAEPSAANPLDASINMLSIPYYTRDNAIMEYMESLRAKKQRTTQEEYYIRKIKEWPYDGQNAKVPIQAMRMGDVAIVGLPAEIFNAIGMEIKRYSPTPHTLVVELANTRASSYVPTTDQAERGGYGAKPVLTRWLCTDAARRMSECAITMLHELWNKQELSAG